jgi:hypothetical protein
MDQHQHAAQQQAGWIGKVLVGPPGRRTVDVRAVKLRLLKPPPCGVVMGAL